MVSTISQGEVWYAAGERPARHQLSQTANRNTISREQDDEGRIRRLGADFFSTIVFIAIYLATDNVLLATAWRSRAPSAR
jgi:hypothetical protein